MKKMLILSVAFASALSLAGCGTPEGDRVAGGAVLGGAAGALIGGAATGRAGGAIAGGLIGAATGAIIADGTQPRGRGRCAQVDYDYYGNRVCTAWY